MTIEDPSLSAHQLPIVAPSNAVSKWVIIGNLMLSDIF